MINEQPIVFFDGICKFCHGSVNLLVALDTNRKLRFASLQSKIGDEISKRLNPIPDSILLSYQGKVFIKSEAVLTIVQLLGFPYNLLGVFKIIPPFIRDFLYDMVAKNRYKIFGKFETCRMPDAFDKERFIE